MNELENMVGPHEHNFVEEETEEGRLLLGPCLSCGMTAGDAIKKANEELNVLAKKCEDFKAKLSGSCEKSIICKDCGGSGSLGMASDRRLISCETCGGDEDSLGSGYVSGSCQGMTVESIKELFKCKECGGAGWTVGLKNGLRGEPEQEQIQCPNCYQGFICLPDREDELAKAIHAQMTGGKK